MTTLVHEGPGSFGAGAQNRAYHCLSISKCDDLPKDLGLGSKWFTCLVIWDARGLPDEELHNFATRLLEQGCVWACLWGPDANRVELWFDMAYLDRNVTEPFVLTTAHDKSIEDAIWFLLNCAFPAEAQIAQDWTAVLVICVGQDHFAQKATKALADPMGFSQFVVDKELD